jgi:hypothetical protein
MFWIEYRIVGNHPMSRYKNCSEIIEGLASEISMKRSEVDLAGISDED